MVDTVGLCITVTFLAIEREVGRENVLPKIGSEFAEGLLEGK